MVDRPTPTNPTPANFGPNVRIFDPSTSTVDITNQISAIYATQNGNTSEMGSTRYALFFKPGVYNIDIDVGYYTTVHGLGSIPDGVIIHGKVQSLATRTNGLALDSFWRGVENLSVDKPGDDSIDIWAVSQATFLRRIHIKGKLDLYDSRYDAQGGNYSSGGFIADSAIDGQVRSGTQQQFLTRNTNLASWNGGVWNMVFVGDQGAPSGTWPTNPYTTLDRTPTIREKPYIVSDSQGNFSLQVPSLRSNVQGTSWSAGSSPGSSIPISQCYIAQPGIDTAATLNTALAQGYHLIFAPGIYHLSQPLNVTWQNTVVFGLGMATLVPDSGTPAMTVQDVDGVSICGLIFDAGPQQSSSLLIVGPSLSDRTAHASNPTALFDVCCRVGGASVGTTQICVTINSHNVLIDNIWIWRADHGLPNTVGWTINPAANGITVNGDDVIAYGLFVEHFQGYQTIWNGERGQVYFYQSEIPYDVPDNASWSPAPAVVKGYTSYKVGDAVNVHTAQGLGVYCNFTAAAVQLDNAIETPVKDGVKMSHMVTFWLNGIEGSSINHIINGTGAAVTKASREAQSAN